MKETKAERIDIFKPYLKSKASYKGGKGKAEVMEKIKGKKLYKLSSNENVLGSSPLAIQAIKDDLGNIFEYPPRKDTDLRIALADFYNHQLSADQFFCENSGVAVLEMIARAFISEGLNAIYCNPAFKPYALFTKREGGTIKDVPLIGDDFLLDIDSIFNAIDDQTRLVFVTNPNNPTGTYIPKVQIDELIGRLPQHVILVYDEVYYQFANKEDYTSAIPYIKEGHNVIAVNSFSKAYGLAGLRIGYAYSTEKIARYIAQLQRPFMLNALGMKAAIAALDDVDFIEKTKKLIKTEKPFLYEELEKANVKYWKTEANFIMIKPTMDIHEFEEKMLLEGVMVRPVDNFGAPGCIRVTIGTREANQMYINSLKKVLNK